ncbi:ATP-binding cassette domain-containing protein [Spiractinospora alimapuensis]|nr:ATP-binding cassette domain-containing protein [Spiractinospora alimapuensis]QVQ50165.1 ATP-binding cassette domain-containing protein [Spiractinospora alimapuensis]
MTKHAIRTEALRKRYGDKNALDGLNLTVPEGGVYGLLGPNGAGKTTAVRVLATLLRFDEGIATVNGVDVQRHPEQVRQQIGLTGQYAAVDEMLSGWQNLVLFGRLFRLSRPAARRRAEELLADFSLTDAAKKSVADYSGGMRRRLDLAVSLILRPRVLFLDEPTTGLDPRSRSEVWTTVRALADSGTTVLLTTQYLEEADQLASRIAVIDSGRKVAEGTPNELKSVISVDRVEVVLHEAADIPQTAEIVERACGGEVTTDLDTRTVRAPVTDRMGALTSVVRALHETGIEVEDIGLRRPTLDEVFLHLTGADSRGAHEEAK